MSLRIFQMFDRSGSSPPPGDDETSPCENPAVVRRFAGVEGLIFDMGDVLFDATAWRRRLLQLLGRMGVHATYRSLFDLWDRDFLDAVHCGRREYAEAFHAFLREAGLTAGQIDELTAASQGIKKQVEADTQPFPGVARTLARLHGGGLRLAVLSDSESPAAAIRARLNQLGIGAYFAEIVSSVELGRTKPDPIGYRTVLDRLQFTADRAAFVGHDADELQGAHRCGLLTIAFNADGRVSADCALRCFSELAQLFAAQLASAKIGFVNHERREAA
jgi:HAD superfamily hydrolase (TIGR01509 family)